VRNKDLGDASNICLTKIEQIFWAVTLTAGALDL